jgi:hypothetical protein
VVAIERLDEDGLWDLSGRIDTLGVLSVYVHADRRQDPNLQAAAIDLRNRFRELQRRIGEEAGCDQSRDVAAALERLWPQIEGLASPTASGRSRIAFAALGSDWILGLESAMPVANRVVLDDGPFPLCPMVNRPWQGCRFPAISATNQDSTLRNSSALFLIFLMWRWSSFAAAPTTRWGSRLS